MVHIQSKDKTRSDFEILKSLGKVIAISKKVFLTAMYEDGSLRVARPSGVTSISKQNIPSILENDPWLKFQIDIFYGIMVMNTVEQFLYKVDDFVFQAVDMTFHKNFKIYFPFSEEWEAEVEII